MHRRLRRWLSPDARHAKDTASSTLNENRVSQLDGGKRLDEGFDHQSQSTLVATVSSVATSGDSSVISPWDDHQEPAYGLKEIVSQSPDSMDCVDIIAIHGLNGHREKTWIDKATKAMWLCDSRFLPNDIPNARVLTFGYNSRALFSRSESNVRDFASELLAGVMACRKSHAERQRPMVFVCHSLGGLVFKQAVVRAHEQDEFYSTLLRRIRGVLFFATPHKGSDLGYWNHIATSLTNIGSFGFLSNPALSRDLKVDSALLKQISESFPYRGGNLKIRSFYETEPMPGLNSLVVEKDSAVLGWPNELDLSSPSHHSNICKFSSPSDQRYQTAISAIIEVIGALNDPADAPFTPREENCMNGLSSNYEYHLEQIDEPVPSTCEWVLNNEKYQQWEGLPSSGLLWVTANPGCGKSVMAKFLVESFQAQQRKTNLCYFFFAGGIKEQDNASAAVSALLHQTYRSQHMLVKHAMTKYESMSSDAFNQFSILWSILLNSINDENARDSLWILDGLDECEPKSLRKFVTALAAYLDSSDVQNALNNKPKLKVLLLSRPSNLMQHHLRLFLDHGQDKGSPNNKYRLAGEDETRAIAADIERFIQFRIDELTDTSAFPPHILKLLHDRLVANADFTFLWISLIMKLINDAAINGISLWQLEEILNTPTLDKVYLHLLKGASQAYPEKTRKLLAIVLASVRPLTVNELCVSVEVKHPFESNTALSSEIYIDWSQKRFQFGNPETHTEPKVFVQNPEGFTMPHSNSTTHLESLSQRLCKPFDSHIRQLCGHFVRIRHNRVYFVHQTAREFLMTASFPLDPSPGPSNIPPNKMSGLGQAIAARDWQPITFDLANLTLLGICVEYIKMVDSKGQGEDTSTWTKRQLSERLKWYRTDPVRVFFPYAAVYWIQHYKSVRTDLNFQFDDLLQPHTSLFKSWIGFHRSWASDINFDASISKPVDITDQSTSNVKTGALDDWEWERSIRSVERSRLKSLARVFYDFQVCLSERLAVSKRTDELVEKFAVLTDGMEGKRLQKIRDLQKLFREGQAGQEISLSTLAREQYLKDLKWLTGDIYRRLTHLKAAYADPIRHFPSGDEGFNLQHAIVDEVNKEEELTEVLLHFGLVDLKPLQVDALAGSWVDRVMEPLNPERIDNDQESDAEEGVGQMIPHRVQHYLAQKAGNASTFTRSTKTPGADLPELSNPGRTYQLPIELREVEKANDETETEITKYDRRVKAYFQLQPQAYVRFREMAAEFRRGKIDTPSMVDKLIGLFNGYPSLIQGFNCQMPSGHSVQCNPANDENSVVITTPNGITYRSIRNAPVTVDANPNAFLSWRDLEQRSLARSLKN